MSFISKSVRIIDRALAALEDVRNDKEGVRVVEQMLEDLNDELFIAGESEDD